MISEIYESDILESSSYFSSDGLELVGRLVESSLLKVDDRYVLPGHAEFKGKRAHASPNTVSPAHSVVTCASAVLDELNNLLQVCVTQPYNVMYMHVLYI